jgi:ribosomal protein S18 acetylase RimI-like enzyme
VIQPVRNRADLLEALERVRRAGAAPVTNWFATPERIDYWIGGGSLCCLEGERGLLILRRDRGFHRIYHSAADLEALSAVLRSSSGELAVKGVLTADLIGRPPDLEPVAGVYRENGFADHNRLIRMIRMAAPEEFAESGPDVAFAGPADVEAVAAFLGGLLDPYTDQIPNEDEIREAASRRNIILVRRGESVGGLLLFETTGVTSHLRYWYVDGGARNQGIGARLIRRFFRLSSGGKRVILWVAGDNSDAIAKYRHYGFRPETLVDRIMIRR